MKLMPPAATTTWLEHVADHYYDRTQATKTED